MCRDTIVNSLRLALTLIIILIAAGCGGEWEPGVDPGVDPPLDPTPPPVAQKRSALQSVVSSITLATSGQEHGLDLDGDGVMDNQIGRFLGEVKQLAGIDLQADLDDQVRQGKALLLYDLLADSLVDASEVQINAYVGQDLDGDPSDNFSGLEAFRVDTRAAQSPVLPAAISAGLLASTKPGLGMVGLPFITDTTVLPLRLTRMQAKVGPDGMRQGILAGAIHVEEARLRLSPVLAKELDRLYRKPGQDPLIVQMIKATLDTNGDGTLTAAEFATSKLFTLFLSTADIDSDGDGKPDAISFGVAFTSVPCAINAIQ